MFSLVVGVAAPSRPMLYTALDEREKERSYASNEEKLSYHQKTNDLSNHGGDNNHNNNHHHTVVPQQDGRHSDAIGIGISSSPAVTTTASLDLSNNNNKEPWSVRIPST